MEDFPRARRSGQGPRARTGARFRDPMLSRPSVDQGTSRDGSFWRPDGTIQYAENPPKKYEDICQREFLRRLCPGACGMELRDSMLFWIREGVRILRVDNPHTKPIPFWRWVIAEINADYPDVIFLAEAFTRPAMMNTARQGRLPAILHLLHVAQREVGDRTIHDRARGRNGGPIIVPISSSIRRTSTRSIFRRAAVRGTSFGRRSPRRCRVPGASIPGSSSARRAPCQVARNIRTRRNTRSRSGITIVRATSRTTSVSSTASVAPTRRCTTSETTRV